MRVNQCMCNTYKLREEYFLPRPSTSPEVSSQILKKGWVSALGSSGTTGSTTQQFCYGILPTIPSQHILTHPPFSYHFHCPQHQRAADPSHSATELSAQEFTQLAQPTQDKTIYLLLFIGGQLLAMFCNGLLLKITIFFSNTLKNTVNN